MKKLLLLIAAIATALTACNGGIDYVIHGEGEGETVYVYETETVTETIEVPVYILVEVPGETEYGEIWVDSDTQTASVDGVDILWVIDTSGSMYRYDAQLIAGIEAMINALPESGWRLAMMSNDPMRAAAEAQFPLVPGDDIADAMDMYNAMGRGGMEEGFDAAYEYLVNNSYATTWLRPDAALLVVFVSDEEEQSNDHMINVSDWTTWFGNQRGGSTYMSSIVNVEQADSICASTPSPIDVGDRYMEATNYFGGVIVDICADDWAPGVTDATSNVEPFETIELTYVPVREETMRVFINGALNWDWHYDSSDNAVHFTVIPVAHDHVDVAYHYDPDDPYQNGSGAADTGDTGS
tara:strand:- start:1104 stop:2162 length:1059 start_codon:yes stop_codon:yes gene_type:complete